MTATYDNLGKYFNFLNILIYEKELTNAEIITRTLDWMDTQNFDWKLISNIGKKVDYEIYTLLFNLNTLVHYGKTNKWNFKPDYENFLIISKVQI
jgi:hypothetical protein